MGIYQRHGHWWYRKRVRGVLRQWSLAKFGITTEAQARAYERAMTKAQLESHLASLDPSRASLGQLTEQFLRERRPYLAATSLDRYRVSLQALAQDLGNDCALRSLTERKLGRWSASRLERGVSPAGVNADLRHIKAALRRAVRWGLIEKAPEVEMVKTPKALPRHLTPEQVERLLEAETRPERKRLWVYLLWTGCRRGEALGLRWEHISWGEAPSARVVGKGERERVVPLLPAVAAALGGMFEPVAGPCCPCPRVDLGLVFPAMHPDTATKWWQRLVRSCGLPEVRLHDLRHTAVTWMLSRGVPARMVMAIVGHANIQTTMGYGKGLVADLYQEMMKGLV